MDLNNLNHKSIRKSNKRTGDILEAWSVLKKCLADMYIGASEKKTNFIFASYSEKFTTKGYPSFSS